LRHKCCRSHEFGEEAADARFNLLGVDEGTVTPLAADEYASAAPRSSLDERTQLPDRQAEARRKRLHDPRKTATR
jgi:hypothetical protein